MKAIMCQFFSNGKNGFTVVNEETGQQIENQAGDYSNSIEILHNLCTKYDIKMIYVVLGNKKYYTEFFKDFKESIAQNPLVEELQIKIL